MRRRIARASHPAGVARIDDDVTEGWDDGRDDEAADDERADDERADDDLDEVIDASWDPPVTRGVRLISVVDDGIQHAGQAAYVAGIVRRRAS